LDRKNPIQQLAAPAYPKVRISPLKRAEKPLLVVGTETFSTAKALRERCRQVLYGHPVEQPIPAPDDAFLRALLLRHRESASKIGCGILDFFVRLQPAYRNRGFYLRRVDGSITDFSFESCIKPPTRRSEVMRGLRAAVQDQTGDFKQRAFARDTPVRCAVSGVEIAFADAHVDHAPPNTFVRIADDFLASRGLSVDDVPINPTTDMDVRTYITDSEIVQAFSDFHRARARLRILSASANLSQGARDR